MTIFDDYGAPQFGLADVKIATYNGTDDYGAEVDVPSVEVMGFSLSLVSEELKGDDKVTATAANAIKGEVQLRWGSINIEALEVILGKTPADYGVSPNQQKTQGVDGGDKMPYFGVCGKSQAAEGDGDTHIFFPKVKLMGDAELGRLEFGQFAIPDMTFTAISDATYGVYKSIEHETSVAITIPPTNIS